MAEFETLWKDAFDAYEKETGRVLLRDSVLRTLHSPEQLLNEIESQQQGFGGWRNRHRKLWTTLTTLLTPVTTLGALAQNAVSLTPFAPASVVLGAVLYLVKASEGVSDAYDWLEAIFSELQEFAIRLGEYAKGEGDATLKKKVTVILTFILFIIARAEHLIKKGRFRQYLHVSFWGKDEKMKAALDRLTKLMDNEERLVIALTYASTQRLEQSSLRTEKALQDSSRAAEELAKNVADLSTNMKGPDGTDKGRERAEKAFLEAALGSTALSKVRELFAEYKTNLLKGSGSWLQEEEIFRTWFAQKAPILWVFGGPGVGKSYLSTSTIVYLREMYPQEPSHFNGISIAYFYVKEDHPYLHDPNLLLKSLALQLVQVDKGFARHALKVCQANDTVLRASDTFQTLFWDFYGPQGKNQSSVYIVIDGLDEAPEITRTTLLALFKRLVDDTTENARPSMQIAIFGRPTLRGDVDFSREEKAIDISVKKNHQDIDRYIWDRMKHIQLLKKMKPQAARSLAKQIRDSIQDRADGMFLWARLAMEQIYKKEKKGDIEEALKDAPKELDDMIRHVFERLAVDQDVNQSDLNTILTWVFCAQRPLRMGEVDAILRVVSGETNLLLRDRLHGKFASIFNLTRRPHEDPWKQLLESDGGTVSESGKSPDSRFAEELNFDDISGLSMKDDGGSDDATDIDLDDDGVSAISADSDDLEEESSLWQVDRRLLAEFEDTEVTFIHKRISDFLEQEGGPQHKWPPMTIKVDVDTCHLTVAANCLDIICGTMFKLSEKRSLFEYAAQNFAKHLEFVDISQISSDVLQAMIVRLERLFGNEDNLEIFFDAVTESRNFGSGLWDWFNPNLSNTTPTPYVKLIQGWLKSLDPKDKESNKGLSTYQKSWIQSAATSTSDFLESFFKVVARRWLDSTGYLDREEELEISCMRSVRYYLSLSDSLWSQFQKIGREGNDMLYAIAVLVQTPQTSNWYNGLGRCDFKLGEISKAESRFTAALQIWPESYHSMEGLAFCYFKRSDIQTAISWMTKALSNIPAGETGIAQRLWTYLFNWKGEEGDVDGSLEAARRAYECDVSNLEISWTYIEALDIASQYEDLNKLLLEFNATTLPNSNYTKLAGLLLSRSKVEGFDPIGRTWSSVTFIQNLLLDIEILIEPLNASEWLIVLLGNIARQYYRYYGRVKDAIRLWETALSKIAQSDNPGGYWHYRRDYTTQLCQLYYDEATATKRAGRDPVSILAKAKKLAVIGSAQDSQKSTEDAYRLSYPAMVYGMWLRKHGEQDNDRWRRYIGPKIIQALDLFEDKDMMNDHVGLISLAAALLCAGDRQRAGAVHAIMLKGLEDADSQARTIARQTAWKYQKRAAMSAVQDLYPPSDDDSDDDNSGEYDSEADVGDSRIPTVDTHSNDSVVSQAPSTLPTTDEPTQPTTSVQTTPTPTPSLNPPPPPTSTSTSTIPLHLRAKVSYFCDGPCTTAPTDYKEIHICEVCWDKYYCESCISLVKRGAAAMGFFECSAQHDHFRAYPVQEAWREAAGVWEEGGEGARLGVRRAWVEELRAEWTSRKGLGSAE